MDRAPREILRPAYAPFYPPPSTSRWSEHEFRMAQPLPPQPILLHPYTMQKVVRKRCHCSDQLNVIEQKVTSLHAMLTQLAQHLHVPLDDLRIGTPEEQRQSPSPIAMQRPASAGEELPNSVFNEIEIPGTSKERRELIRKMEEELAQRKEQNKKHEDRIAGLKDELEELRSKRRKLEK